MIRTYSFNASCTCKTFGTNFDALCIAYANNAEVSSLQLFSDLEASIKECSTLPDCVVIMADAELTKKLFAHWNDDPIQRETILDRGIKSGCPFVKNYYFFAWDNDQLEVIDNHLANTKAYKISSDELIQQGLRNLLVKNEVVQIAPAGHLFKHPSGTKSKVFIQAREMAKSEAELCFVANALRIHMRETLRIAEVVFIDTMGIYHFVREALRAAGSLARVESYHSYDEMKKLLPPSVPYACVISASTSGGMANKLVSKQRFKPDNIVTLIDISTSGRSGTVLMPLDKQGTSYAEVLLNKTGSETEIELVGEHFSSKAKPPRAVVLGKPHKPEILEDFLAHLLIPKNVRLNALPHEGAAHPKLICLDVSSLPNNKEFAEWLNDEIAWSISLAVDHIIHMDDPTSKEIATLAAQMIQDVKQISSPPCVISYSELRENEQYRKELKTGAKGILVISAIAGDGGLLREISRDLREYVKTELPRHFLVAVGLPQSKDSWERLKQFLVTNPTDRRYGFSNWHSLPVGYDGKDSAWSQLANLANQATGDTGIPILNIENAIVDESLEQASAVISQNHQGFLPKTNGEPLALTAGFVFFCKHFDQEIVDSKVLPGAVYLTIASALQCARELKDKNNQLKSTGYESVVLAPECFLRFNDNILQACLLRACHPSELDYSASPHLSKLVKELLTKVFSRHDHPYGAAALEFAAALATGRLKLKKDDFDVLVKEAIESLKKQPSPLLGLLLLAKQ